MNGETKNNKDLFVQQEPVDPRPNVLSLGDGEDETYYLCGICKKEFSISDKEDGYYFYPTSCPYCNTKFILGDGMCIYNDRIFEIEGIDMDKNCKYDCLYKELCEKNDEDIKLCSEVRKDINIAANIEIVEYKDIENVRKYVDKILKLEKDSGVTFQLLIDNTGDLICPACGGIVFSKLSNSDSFTCITCYRKHYVDNYGWYDLEYYDLMQDMTEREKIRRLMYDAGNLNTTKKLLKIHKKRNKKNKINKEYSNIGEVLLNMDEFTVVKMNGLLGELNQDNLLYDTKEDAVKYIKGEIGKYNFDMDIENYEDNKDEYDVRITWKGNRILDGFVRVRIG